MFLARFAAKAAIILILMGIFSLYTASTQRKLETVGIEAIAEKKPDSRWVRIEGGVFDITRAKAVGFRGTGHALKLYVPLVKPDYDAANNLIHVLVLTDEPGVVKLYNELNAADELPPEKQIEFILKNRDALRISRPVQGLIQSDWARGGSEEWKVAKSYENDLKKDFVLIEEGAKPSFGTAFAMVGGGLGLVLLSGLLGLLFGKKKVEPPPVPQATPPPLPGVSSEGR